MWKTGILIVIFFFFTLLNPVFAAPVHFEINAGYWGGESSWTITGDSFSEGQNLLPANTTYVYDWDLNPGAYNLYMTDSWGDGLSGGGFVDLIVDGETLLDLESPLFAIFSYDFDVLGASPVPEPSTFLLLGGGLAGLLAYSRKRKKV